jgi:hypothetical protein
MDASRINEDKKKVAIEKRRSVQRTLNNRGNAKTSLPLQIIQESMKVERRERQQRIHEQSIRVKLEVNSPSYRSMVARFNDVFSQNLSEFMTELKHADNDIYTPRAMNLALRLDFNAPGESTRSFDK